MTRPDPALNSHFILVTSSSFFGHNRHFILVTLASLFGHNRHFILVTLASFCRTKFSNIVFIVHKLLRYFRHFTLFFGHFTLFFWSF